MRSKVRAFCFLFVSLFKTTYQLLYGVWKVSQLPQPIVTVFGGARLIQSSPYARMAHDLTHRLINENISVITGGGPGIMQATGCVFLESQVQKRRAKTLGITVRGLEREIAADLCNYERIVMDYFFARKWLMINYAVAFAVFPGGFGTVDEMAEVITLMQTKKLPGVPVVLIGSDYWRPFMQWVYDSALAQGLISPADVELIVVVDEIDEIVRLLKQQCEICG